MSLSTPCERTAAALVVLLSLHAIELSASPPDLERYWRKPATLPVGAVAQYEVVTPTEWWLRITVGGDALLGFGASRFTVLKPSAIWLSEYIPRLQEHLSREGNHKTYCALLTYRAGDTAGETRYTSDGALVNEMFEQALKLLHGDGLLGVPEAWRDLAKQHPIVPAELLDPASRSAKPDAARQRWFSSTDDGQTWFADSADNLPPYQVDGKTAVRAFVVVETRNPTRRFVGYLLRYNGDAKAILRGRTDASKPLTAEEKQAVDKGTEVKRPGDAQWTPILDAQEIIQELRGPDGNRVMPVFPEGV